MDRYAYVARYGNQPISEIRSLTMRELEDWTEAFDRLVKRENGKEA